MAYDSMLYRATITAGGEVTLNQIVGSSTVRQGYGKARIVSIQSFYHKTVAADSPQVQVTVKNNNWVRPSKLWAGNCDDPTAHAKDTMNYMYMHGYELPINSTFVVSAKDMTSTTFSGTVTVDVLITIDYDKIPAINPDKYEGCPVTFECSQSAGVTGAAGSIIRLGSYDVLDPGVAYCLNEISCSNVQGMMYVIIEGLQPQQGLIRLIPVPPIGARIIPTILGSVSFTKQSFTVAVLSDVAITSQIIPVYLELLASKNGIA